jgi:hypothetical protein
MPTHLLIHAGRFSPALEDRGVAALEDDLHDLLGPAGETTYSGVGCGLWSIDVSLNDGEPVEVWLERLARFLREWGAPQETSIRVV